MDYDSAYNEVRRTIERIADELDSQLGQIADRVESLEFECEQRVLESEQSNLQEALQLEKNKVAELQGIVTDLERTVREKNAAIVGYKNLLAVAVRCGGIF